MESFEQDSLQLFMYIKKEKIWERIALKVLINFLSMAKIHLKMKAKMMKSLWLAQTMMMKLHLCFMAIANC